MTGDEAIEAMKSRLKVRASAWWWGRYIYMTNGHVLSESGKLFPREQLKDTNSWEIYQEEKHGAHNEQKTEAGD